MIHFVGAGSGAVDLITVRGQRLLENADVVIYAGSLVNPELLEYTKKDCKIFNSAYMTLEEVIAEMVSAEENGLETVRLHTGDPSIYGAIREQIDELERLGIKYDICPGVSSFFAAASTLGIEYTLPDVSQSLIITRAEGRTPVPEKEQMKKLAAHGASMAVFLSASMAGRLQEELLAYGGYDEETPCAVVYKATWEDEIKIVTKLGKLADAVEKNGIRKTAIILVGRFLGGEYELSKLYDKNFTTEFRTGVKDAAK